MKNMIRALTAILCLSFLLVGCGKRIPELTYYPSSGGYYDSKKDITYYQAELYYEPQSLRRDLPVAQISDYAGEVVLYQIERATPEQMLANESFELFCAEGISLPALWEMQADTLYVGAVTSGATMDMAVATVTNRDDVANVIALYQNGTSFAYDQKPATAVISRAYHLRFASAEHPAIYYRLSYYEYTNDVMVYEVIESKESFTPTYSGVPVSFNEEYLDRGELYAVYNFGKGLIYDEVTERFYPAGDAISKHLSTAN